MIFNCYNRDRNISLPQTINLLLYLVTLSLLQTAKPEESSNTVGSTTTPELSSTNKHPKKVRNSGEISSTHFLLNLDKYSNIKYPSRTCFNIRRGNIKMLIKKSSLIRFCNSNLLVFSVGIASQLLLCDNSFCLLSLLVKLSNSKLYSPN